MPGRSGGFAAYSEEEIAAQLGVPRLAMFHSVGSTQDEAHALAAKGAPAGTLILAHEQTSGRGRSGRQWNSAAGAGLWFTLIERPKDLSAIGVMSLRLAINVAPVLEQWSDSPVTIKWPNDIFAGGRKLAGLLVETRWRADVPEWVAVGVGVNLREPQGLEASALRPGSPPLGVLRELVAAIRIACAATGLLRAEELEDYARRDGVRGRRARAPVRGTVAGIATDGSLIIQTTAGKRVEVHAGSLILEDEG